MPVGTQLKSIRHSNCSMEQTDTRSVLPVLNKQHRLSQEDEFPVVNNTMVNKWLRKRQVKLLVHSEVSTTDKAEDRVESRVENVIGANTREYKAKTVTSAATRTETGQIWRVRTVVEKGHSHQSGQDSKATARHGSAAGIKGSVDTSFPTSHSIGQSQTLKSLLPLKDWILYMDDRIVAINKPAGIAVQGGTGIETSVDSSLQVLQDAHGQKPRLVHRLDKTTSGVLILARTRKAAQELTNRFHDGTMHSKQDNTLTRKIEKKYIAIVGSNEPLLNTATDHLARLQVDMAVLTQGKQERIQILHQNNPLESAGALPANRPKAPAAGALCTSPKSPDSWRSQGWFKDDNDKNTADSLKDWDVSKNGALTIRARIPTDMAQEMHRLRLRV
ncbi:hypothetical protein BG011_003896 [Mortierella polycephala]|uniref:21S rRNA pseudouridine(2819) synthase n=1 Tax=Mortierella polycephala TaxID=41804 RepID=A0A9P6Q3V5_9FUNG|nr:hypothetical protein BG011_003896 [Mortierella polycephala]